MEGGSSDPHEGLGFRDILCLCCKVRVKRFNGVHTLSRTRPKKAQEGFTGLEGVLGFRVLGLRFRVQGYQKHSRHTWAVYRKDGQDSLLKQQPPTDEPYKRKPPQEGPPQ